MKTPANEKSTDYLYEFEEYQKSNPFMFHNHIEQVELSPERCRVKVDLVHESMNINGAVHGGLFFAMADICAGIHSRMDGNKYVTQSSHVNFLRNTKGRTVFCETEIVKRGRQVVIIHFQVTDDDGRLLCDGVMDYMRI